VVAEVPITARRREVEKLPGQEEEEQQQVAIIMATHGLPIRGAHLRVDLVVVLSLTCLLPGLILNWAILEGQI
jgi:hypothetical protein